MLQKFCLYSVNRIRLCAFLLVCILAVSSVSWGEDEEEGEAESEEESTPAIYVQIKPSFVTNFLTEKVRYIKADVAVRVNNAETQNAIEQHMDAIKDGMVMLFSRQEYEAVISPEGVSVIREEALEIITEILDAESAPSELTEVLFTSFIVE